MPLTLYSLSMSQPCRSVVMFMKLNNIECSIKVVDVTKRETETPEFLAINPNHKIPALDDDGFVIWESVAIVKYLAAKYKTPDHWYPVDIKERARVDQFCDWHHTNIRLYGQGLFFDAAERAMLGMPAVTAEVIATRYQELDDNLGLLETLLRDNKFLCGDEITIADIFCANEVLQTTVLSRDIYANHAATKAWMDRVRDRLNPVWDEATRDILNQKGKL